MSVIARKTETATPRSPKLEGPRVLELPDEPSRVGRGSAVPATLRLERFIARAEKSGHFFHFT